MKTEQLKLDGSSNEDINFNLNPNLILAFASSDSLEKTDTIKRLREKYPDAVFAGCSTAGEIAGITVTDNTMILTAVNFESTKLVGKSVHIDDYVNSYEVGEALVKELNTENLRHVLVFSDGLNVNGAELVKGIQEKLPEQVNVTGGLAGDGPDFQKTYVLGHQGDVSSKIVSAIGFYGDKLTIGYGSMGGWDSFGMERLVTKSEGNVLYELDGEPALKLYKSFLGEKAKDLPSSGLLFPLSMRINANDKPVVRTILAVNEEDQSMTFAGDIPENAHVRLMKANIDRLINGAGKSAENTLELLEHGKSDLALLISCVGRKLVLKQLVEEEVEAVSDVLGDQAVLTGFYSYGEIAPFGKFSACELHNQTMTVTTFSEN